MIRLSRLVNSHYMPVWVGIIAFCLFLPGRMSLPPLDRDEARYMQATSQMVQSHNYVDIHYQNDVRYVQPAGVYWLEAASLKLVGKQFMRSPWPYRIPTLFAMTGAMVITAIIGRMFFGSLAGFLSSLMLMSSLLITAESRMATTDSCLLFVILLGQWALVKTLKEIQDGVLTRKRNAIIFWSAIGFGLMIKGPIVCLSLIIPPIVFCLVKRDWRLLQRMYPSCGWVISAIIALPWFMTIGFLTHGSFFSHALAGNFFGKITHVQESHGAPPGFYALIFLLSFWPASDFFVAALPGIFRDRKQVPICYLLCWIIVPWIILEAIPTKLPHYVMPLYPAIAILTGEMLARGEKAFIMPMRNKFMLSFITCYGMIWAGVGLLFASSGFLALRIFQNSFSYTALITGFVVLIFLCIALWRACWHHFLDASIASAIAAFILYTSLFMTVIPSLNMLWISPRLVSLLERHNSCPVMNVHSISYAEPSFVFLQGGNVHLGHDDNLISDAQKSPKCTLILTSRRDEEGIRQLLDHYQIPFIQKGKVSGFNYSKGRFMHITLYGAP